jgi:CYTH domain-containing protein
LRKERAMGREIERKFLVKDGSWRAAAAGEGTRIRQGYLETGGGATVRVRLAGGEGFLTLKGPTMGIARTEYEYRIPAGDAEEMLDGFCGGRVVEKTRWRIPAGEEGLVWEVDVYEERNAPLVTAEIEVPEEGTAFGRPAWLGEEVSGEARYRNSELAVRPVAAWAGEGESGCGGEGNKG